MKTRREFLAASAGMGGAALFESSIADSVAEVRSNPIARSPGVRFSYYFQSACGEDVLNFLDRNGLGDRDEFNRPGRQFGRECILTLAPKHH